MRILKLGTICLFLLSFIVFCSVNIKTKTEVLNTTPVITAEEAIDDIFEFSVSEPAENLLKGLTATDEEDGDLTKDIIVENKSYISEDNCINVKFAVFDSSGKAGTYTRKIHYYDYESPMITLKEPLVGYVGESFKVRPLLEAKDCIDGDISDQIQILDSTIVSSIAGAYKITLKIENSVGDSTTVQVPFCMRDRTFQEPSINLKKAIEYLDKGETFIPENYILSVKDSEGNNLDFSQVEIISNVDVSVPGCYSVTYFVKDNDASCQICLGVVVRQLS